MALSGTINGSVTNLSARFSFYATWSAVQSISGNYSDVTVNTYWSTNNTSYTFDTVSKRSASITINGTAESISQRFDCNPWASGGKYLIQTSTVRVYHNADGTKSITISARANGYASSYGPSNSSSSSGDCTASGTITLDTIPRYASITQSMSSRTETSISVNWTTDATVDRLWYSINDGSTYTAVTIAESTSGSYTVTGLSAYTNYKIKTKVRRKDSQLTSESTALSVYTYPYPYANSMPNFTIGNTLTIGLYNPLGRTVTVEAIGANNAVIGSGTTSGTSIAGYKTAGMITNWYASIPNAQSGTYKVRVTYSGNATTKTGGTYSVNTSVCAPVIGSFTYADVNSTTTALTGNNQDIVRNHSTVRYTASGLSAQYSATLSSASVAVNNRTYSLTLSGTSATGGNAVIDSGTDVEAVVTVTDSRGVTSTKSVTVHMLDWSTPSAIITLQRHNNFYSQTDITVDADYASINGNNQITITYQATRDGSSSASVSGTLQDNVTAVATLDNNYGWTVKVTLTDSLGGTTTYSVYVSRGMPIIYFDRLRSSVGVNCFPQNDQSFEVDGLSILSNNIRPVTSVTTASVTLPSESGHMVTLGFHSGSGAITVNIPQGLAVGYECYLMPTYQVSRVTLATSGSESLSIAGRTATTATIKIPVPFPVIHLMKVTGTRWFMESSAPDCYTAGDVITQADVRMGVGCITTTSTELAFDLPLAKPLLGVSSASVTTMTGHCRSSLGGYIQYADGNGGYTQLYNRSWLTCYDSMTVSPQIGHLRFSLKCNAKWGLNSATVTNNSLIMAQFTSLSITLA